MNWDIIAATGEWAGAIAVVASLLYLGRQIHLANLQFRSAARYSFLDAYGTANATISHSRDAAGVFRRGMDGEDLDPDERMQFTVQVGQFLNTWSVMYDLHNEGQLPENQWEIVRTDILALFTSPGGRWFWDAIGKANVTSTFRDWINTLIESETATYSMTQAGN